MTSKIATNRKYNKEQSIKDVRTKSQKIDPLVRTGSTLLSFRIHHKFRTLRRFLQCERPHLKNPLVRTGQTPFLPDCGRLLWTANSLAKRVNGDLKYIFFAYKAMFRMVWSFLPGWSSLPNFASLMSWWRHIYKNYVIFFRQVDSTLLHIFSVVIGAEVSNLTQLTSET